MKFKRVGKCNMCGGCCSHLIIVLDDNEASEHSRKLWPSRIETVLKDQCNVECDIFSIPCPCEKLDANTKKCLKYDMRPEYCSNWPISPFDPVWLYVKKHHNCGFDFVEDKF